MNVQLPTDGLIALKTELKTVKAWLVTDALPFWSTAGFSRDTKLFEERLDFSGQPARDAPHRLMVQCRQIYVYSHASLLGWFDGRDLVEQALQSLKRLYKDRLSGVPYVFSVSRTGDVVDAKRDAYGYAFLLFALAWARRLLGSSVDSGLAAEVLAYFRTELTHGSGEGFIDGLPRPNQCLRQNPQMHLFEAALEVQDAFGIPDAGLLAHQLFGLFRDRLFQGELSALPELFDDHWRAVRDPGASFEPGHHFEWIWLLDRYAARSGVNVDGIVAALARRAYSEGVDRDGAVVETVALAGSQRKNSRRCWGTCEALKAAASDFEQGRTPARAIERATMFLRALQSVFLAQPFQAGWIDRVDHSGEPLIDFAPASTLYHVFLAVAEADRVFSGASAFKSQID